MGETWTLFASKIDRFVGVGFTPRKMHDNAVPRGSTARICPCMYGVPNTQFWISKKSIRPSRSLPIKRVCNRGSRVSWICVVSRLSQVKVLHIIRNTLRDPHRLQLMWAYVVLVQVSMHALLLRGLKKLNNGQETMDAHAVLRRWCHGPWWLAENWLSVYWNTVPR